MSANITTSGGAAVHTARRVKPRTRLRRILVTIAAALLVLLVVAYFGISAYVADQLSRPPRRAIASTPAQYGLSYEEVSFRSAVDNILLRGWYIDSPGTAAVIMVHGRAAARNDGPSLPVANALVRRGYDVLLFDFRAHGLSEGERYSMGQREIRDIAGAVQYLKDLGVSDMAGYGTSMGAATLLRAAADLPELKVIVADSAFADLTMLLDKELPKVSGLPSLFNPGISLSAKLLFDVDFALNKPVEAMPALDQRPVFLIHTESDDTIPVEQAYMLQNAGALNSRIQVWIAPGQGHTAAYSNHPEEYLQKVGAFYDKYMP